MQNDVGKTLRFGLTAIVGAGLGLIVGHYLTTSDAPLSVWFEHPIRNGHWAWLLGGGATAVAIRYLMVTV